MHLLHDAYPDYGFDHHVGYATAGHQAAIVEHGVCELHRLSFASAAYRQLGLGRKPHQTADGGGCPGRFRAGAPGSQSPTSPALPIGTVCPAFASL